MYSRFPFFKFSITKFQTWLPGRFIYLLSSLFDSPHLTCTLSLSLSSLSSLSLSPFLTLSRIFSSYLFFVSLSPSLSIYLSLTANLTSTLFLRWPQVQIKSPVFIIGLPRTGSTIFHRLLSLDKENRAILGWEMVEAPSLARSSHRWLKTKCDLLVRVSAHSSVFDKDFRTVRVW